MLRRLFSKLSSSLEGSYGAPRQSVQVPIRISLEPRRGTGALEAPGRVESVFGVTNNVSRSGIAFLVPSIRIRENYLVGEGRILNAELDLPNGRVKLKCVGKRYERLEAAGGCTKYFIAAEIVGMAADQRSMFEVFVDGPKKVNAAGALSLGADKG